VAIQTSQIALTTIALSLFLSPTAFPDRSVWAADLTNSAAPSASPNAAHERAALRDIGRARHAAQNRKAKDLLDQIESAETALLNVDQLARDPHIDAALERLKAAREAAVRGDLHGAEALLALATADVTVALATAAIDTTTSASDIVPMAGDVVYDADADQVGKVVDVVYDEDGEPSAIVIDVGAFLGAGDKDVSVPPRDAEVSPDRVTVKRSKEQLSEAPNSPPPNYGPVP
jgi:hypothetical protein